MTSIAGLVQSDPQADPENGKVFYERVVLTVGKPSQFSDPVTKRPKGCAFREIEGFWNWSEAVLMGQSPPPFEGDVISVSLSTKPMPNKPGSKYHDIVAVYRTEQQPIASQRQQQPPPQAQSTGSPPDFAEVPPLSPEGQEIKRQLGLDTPAGRYLYDERHYYFEDKAERKTAQILKSQAWNGLTVMLAGGNHGWDGSLLTERHVMWHDGFVKLMSGDVPFTEPPATEAAEQPECRHPEWEWLPMGQAGEREAGEAQKLCKSDMCMQHFDLYVAPKQPEPQQESGMLADEQVEEIPWNPR